MDVFPICLVKLPATAQILPPVDVIVSVLLRIVRKMPTKSSHAEVSPIVVLETIVDIVSQRLQHLGLESLNANDTVEKIKSLSDSYYTAVVSLLKTLPAESGRLVRLITRRKEIDDYGNFFIGRCGCLRTFDQITAANDQPWNGWRNNPTVGWLMNGALHDVEDLKNSYTSAYEYSEALLRVWVLLAFYWGSGAVWPKCTFKKGTKDGVAEYCNEPLLQQTTSGVCRSSYGGVGCKCKVSWRCHKQGHDHICLSCLKKQQDVICGNPSTQASTDIYDAVIERQVNRREECVYLLSSLQSRRPPRIAPNWKTTYRLPCSVLVGVCRLSLSGEALARDRQIEWAEVIPYDHFKGANLDWEYRTRGQMAIRLLTKGDCFGMPSESDSRLEIGTRVAIIDLRVFVPEVISVLSTFSRDDFSSHLNQIPFVQKLIGNEASPAAVFPDFSTTTDCASINQLN